jgi:chloramphenicol 3-O phosphotransferase
VEREHGEAGRVVFLNGTSSAGKSSIARELQRRAAGPLLVAGVDTFLSMLQERYFGDPEGFEVVTVSMTPQTRRVRPGPVGRRLLAGFHSSVAGLARAGIDVVVDDVVLDRWCLEDYVRALDGLDVVIVGVRCSVEVAAEREKQRGDRTIGLARGHHETAHEHVAYDVEVDTSASTIAECADAIEAILANPPEKRAFDSVRERRRASPNR